MRPTNLSAYKPAHRLTLLREEICRSRTCIPEKLHEYLLPRYAPPFNLETVKRHWRKLAKDKHVPKPRSKSTRVYATHVRDRVWAYLCSRTDKARWQVDALLAAYNKKHRWVYGDMSRVSMVGHLRTLAAEKRIRRFGDMVELRTARPMLQAEAPAIDPFS